MEGRLEVGRTFVSHGYHNKMPETECLQIIEICPFIFWRQKPEIKVLMEPVPSGGRRENLAQASLPASVALVVFGVAWLTFASFQSLPIFI